MSRVLGFEACGGLKQLELPKQVCYSYPAFWEMLKVSLEWEALSEVFLSAFKGKCQLQLVCYGYYDGESNRKEWKMKWKLGLYM